jgi:hypothetical protein
LYFSYSDKKIDFKSVTDAFFSFIDGSIEYLKSYSSDPQLKDKSDLLNIRDEMLGTLNQLKYLLNKRLAKTFQNGYGMVLKIPMKKYNP